MKKIHIYIFTFLAAIGLSSCFGDLDTIPIDQDIATASNVYKDPSSYRQVLAKLYAGLALTGQEGPAGQSDIEGIDEGFGQYLRALWYHQEFPTDEAVVGWNDQTIKDFHEMDWTSLDPFIFAFYSRIFYQIPLCNEFLRETTDEKLNERGVEESLKTEIQGFRAEARFLRALSYYHALDHFRNVPFITEEDVVGSFFPEQINGADLFNYIEAELLDIENSIAAANSNEYGRADQAAVWTLLATLYLNAEVYTSTAHYDECVTYCEKVFGTAYQMDPIYQNLFLADNHTSPEIIFPIVFDGIDSRTWGGTTFIVRAGIGGSMNPAESGVNTGWGGTRTTPQLVEKFGKLGGLIYEANEGNTQSYAKIYTPGSFQGFDFSDTNNALSSVNNDKIYEGHKYFPEANTAIRITQIPSESAPYFGDNNDDGILDQFGEDIIIDEPGLYYFQVDLNENTYLIEKREWAVVGDAAAGWDEDIPMTFDEETGAMAAEINMLPGEFKFRANGTWDINLGDTFEDRILEYEGDNIKLNEPGVFKVSLFLNRPDYTFEVKFAAFDIRNHFYSDGQNLDINDITLFTDGYAVNKFKNVTSDGQEGSDIEHCDIDFPLFRLADVYLMASEALLRSGGNIDKAAEYFNVVRTRAYAGSTAGNVLPAQLNLDLMIDERARELYWEAKRRTDLIRFNLFTTDDYLWQWKGGVQSGKGVEAFRKLYPIPNSDMAANPNLVQNEGY